MQFKSVVLSLTAAVAVSAAANNSTSSSSKAAAAGQVVNVGVVGAVAAAGVALLL